MKPSEKRRNRKLARVRVRAEHVREMGLGVEVDEQGAPVAAGVTGEGVQELAVRKPVDPDVKVVVQRQGQLVHLAFGGKSLAGFACSCDVALPPACISRPIGQHSWVRAGLTSVTFEYARRIALRQKAVPRLRMRAISQKERNLGDGGLSGPR